MADNVVVTAGTGTTIAADEVVDATLGTVKAQYIKIMDGVLDSTSKLRVTAEDAVINDGDTGILAMVKRMDTPANLSGTDGDAEFLQVSGGMLWTRRTSKLVRIQTDITRPADTTAYAVGDAISDSTSAPTSGGFTFSSAARVSGGGGIIRGFNVCSSNDPATTLAGQCCIFDRSVTNINDNAAYAITDAEAKTLITRLNFVLDDHGNNGVYDLQGLEIPYVCNGSANLRFLVRALNAYTPANAEVLTFTITVEYYD